MFRLMGAVNGCKSLLDLLRARCNWRELNVRKISKLAGTNTSCVSEQNLNLSRFVQAIRIGSGIVDGATNRRLMLVSAKHLKRHLAQQTTIYPRYVQHLPSNEVMTERLFLIESNGSMPTYPGAATVKSAFSLVDVN